MKRTNRTYVLIALGLCALLAGATVAHAASNKSAVSKGATWIRKARMSTFPGTGFQSDTVSALAAARKAGVKVSSSTVARFVDELKKNTTQYVGGAGPTGKLMLAVVASGNNPRCFGPVGERSDLYNILMSDYDEKSGQFGSTVYDHALALLALKAVHQKIPSKAVKFAKDRRGQYGWSFGMSAKAGDDVESTAIMIEALRAAGVSKKDGGLKSAYKWIGYQRNSDGGFNPDGPQLQTQADTTAYAIRAADALGINNSKAKTALRALQQKNGGFRSSPSAKGDYMGISTANGVLALSGQHYPVVVRSKAGASCV